MRCIQCKKDIVGRYVQNRFWETALCEGCVEGQVCAWCNQFGNCRPVEGIDVCKDCRRHIIDEDYELEDLKTEALKIITRHIGPNNLNAIPVVLKKEHEFGEAKRRLGVAVSGETKGGSEFTVLGIETGIPHSYALAVLCHEFGHAMLYRDHQTLEQRATAGTHAIEVEEGFCQVLFAIAIQSHSDPVARWQSFLLPVDPDPVYGEGFRMMWRAAQEVGSVAALLEVVSKDPVPFRGPRLDAVIDEAADDDDLVPMAERTGDPTKKPLRGTALRVEEAPADAPRGPRLRGTAVAVAKEHEKEERETKKGLRGTGLALLKVKEAEAKHPRKDYATTETPPPKRPGLRGKGLK